jgi:hypothetical protein
MKINQNTKGNYKVKIWDRGYFALFKKQSGELFDEKNKINVLIHTNLNFEENHFAMFLALGLSKDSDLNVIVSNSGDLEVVENAHFIFNLSNKKRFRNSLAKYDDGTRLIVNKIQAKVIQSKKDFRGIAKLIKTYFSKVQKEKLMEVRVR